MWAITFVCCTFIFVLLNPAARADELGNTLTITPASVDVELAQNESQRKITFTLKNSYNVPIALSVELRGIDDISGAIVPANELPGELAAAFSLSESEFVVPEQSTYFLTLTVQNNEMLAASGGYITLLVTQRRDGGERVTFQQSLSVAVFISKKEGQIRRVELNEFTAPTGLFSVLGRAEVSVKNTGNVFLVPRAVVSVTDKQGELVAQGVANKDSRRVLPGKIYQETIRLRLIKRVWLPGKLRVTLGYRADGIEEVQLSSREYFYIPPQSMFLVGVFGILLYGILRLIRKFRRRRTARLHAMAELPRRQAKLINDIGMRAKPVKKTPKKRKIKVLESTDLEQNASTPEVE